MNDKYIKQVSLLVKCLPIIATENCFAIKGGTAINLFYSNLPRLSVDIDLVYLPIEDRQTTLNNIHKSLERIKLKLSKLGLSVQSNNKTEEKLICFDNISEIKIEPNYVYRGFVYEPITMEICPKAQSLFGYTKAKVISKVELWGGKICAALDRQHPRDLFDIANLFKNGGIDNHIKEGFMVSLLSSSRPIHEILAPNFHLTEETIAREFSGMTDSLFSFQDARITFNRLVDEIKLTLTQADKTMLLDFVQLKANAFSPSIPNFSNLPSIKWKEQNLRNLALTDNQKFQQLYIRLKEVFN